MANTRVQNEVQSWLKGKGASHYSEVIMECALVGAAILNAQRVEFLLYGAISHIAGLSQTPNKQFRTLDGSF